MDMTLILCAMNVSSLLLTVTNCVLKLQMVSTITRDLAQQVHMNYSVDIMYFFSLLNHHQGNPLVFLTVLHMFDVVWTGH